jgi:hypothetical protein
MSKGVHDMFVMVINLLRFNLKLEHVTIGLFEIFKTTGWGFAKKKTNLMNKCWLFFDALHATITMALKLKDKFGMTPFIINLMGHVMVVALELSMFVSNIKKMQCFKWFSFIPNQL